MAKKEMDYDYEPQIGDEVEMSNGKQIEKGIVVAPEEGMEAFKKEWGNIPPFLIKWPDGIIEDWTGQYGTFCDMGGVITKKVSKK